MASHEKPCSLHSSSPPSLSHPISLPWFLFVSPLTGKLCLVKLLEAGVTCSYVLINAVPYIMKEVRMFNPLFLVFSPKGRYVLAAMLLPSPKQLDEKYWGEWLEVHTVGFVVGLLIVWLSYPAIKDVLPNWSWTNSILCLRNLSFSVKE